MPKQVYDEDPVFYCKRCLSLNIKEMPLVKDQCYCGKCGTVDIGTIDIKEWEKLYEKRYGQPHLKKREIKWPYWS